MIFKLSMWSIVTKIIRFEPLKEIPEWFWLECKFDLSSSFLLTIFPQISHFDILSWLLGTGILFSWLPALPPLLWSVWICVSEMWSFNKTLVLMEESQKGQAKPTDCSWMEWFSNTRAWLAWVASEVWAPWPAWPAWTDWPAEVAYEPWTAWIAWPSVH